MKKIPTRVTALALAALLAAGPAASASQALGTEIHMGRTHLAEGVDYTRQYLWSATYSDLRTERYLSYSPNELVQPAVAYGDTVLSKNTLSSLALDLEDQGKRVLGGVNGDYFVVATGAPLGMVVTDGVLRSSSSYHYALGFDADGNAFIGQPELAITATFGGYTFAVSGGLNKVRSETGSFVLYTGDYNATTNHTGPGIDVILTPSTENLGRKVDVDLEVEEVEEPEPQDISPEEEELPDEEDGGAEENREPKEDEGLEEDENPEEDFTGSEDLDLEELGTGETVDQVRDTLVYTDVPIIGGRMACTVEQVIHSTGSIAIPEGKLVLSINSKNSPWLVEQLSSLQPGDAVKIDITSPDERWEKAVTAVGGLYKMVTGGVVEPGLETTQAPRTAVGIRADGSTIFYTVDGRQSGYSVGASMEQVAKRLVELGCVEAVCMDGGGSTTLGASLPGWESFNVLNKPSDGSQRAVSNALFLVAEQTRPGRAEYLTVSPSDALLLADAELELSALGVDELGQAVELYEGDEIDFDLPGEGGRVKDGILTAGDTPGTYTLEARAGRLEGSALITVVSTPDRILVRKEGTGTALSSLNVEPGETVHLSAAAAYRNLALVSQDEAFTWSVSEGLGTIDQSGTLTVGSTGSTGAVTVKAGDRTLTIPVTMEGHINTVESFEGEFLNMADSMTAQIRQEQRPAYVRYGRQSARVSYDMGESEFAAVGVPLDFQEGEGYLSLWVYGDGSGNTLTAPVRLADESSSEQTLAVLNFTGWQQITTPLPEGAQQVLVLKIVPTGTTRQGTIWLDQVTSSNQADPDTTAPQVSVKLSAVSPQSPETLSLSATLRDNVDRNFTDGQISVTYDGWALPFAWDGAAVTAALPAADGLAHRITVTATDASGNIGRASVDIAAAAEAEEPFGDMAGHWAENYVNYLHDQGISDGLAVGEEANFLPEQELNRGEFALMVTRWLHLDPAAYSGVQLPFLDQESIPAGYLDSVKAMYARGIMQGSGESDGLYAFAEKPLSRAEAMTMLGRLQEKGYATTTLEYADAADVPSWAAEYMATMVAQGIIEGYNNSLWPHVNIKRCEMAKILYTMR